MSPREKRIFTIILAVLLYCMSAVAILAAVVTYVKEQYKITAGTNAFYPNGNAYYKSAEIPANGSYQVSVTKALTGFDTNVTYDIIIKPDSSSDLQYLSVSDPAIVSERYSNSYDVYGTDTDSVKYPSGALVFTDISETSFTVGNSGGSHVSVTVILVRHTEHNHFISSYFELQMSETEELRNFGEENKGSSGAVVHPEYAQGNIHSFDYNGAYVNLYIIDSFNIPEAYEYNAPCYINLLNSTVTLDDTLTIKHDYAGLFAITSLTGGSFAGNLEINTPSAYYVTSSIENPVIGIKSTLTKYSSADALAYDGAVAALQTDAADYIRNYLQNCMYKGEGSYYYVCKSFELPSQYHGYPITYSYSGISTDGKIDRGAETVSGTITASVMYNSATVGTYTQNVKIIGTNESELAAAYINTLGGYVNKNQPAGADLTSDSDILTKGIDIFGFTKEFCADTGFNINNYSLSFGGNKLGFRIFNTENTAVKTNTATFTVSGSVTGVSEQPNTAQVIIYHPYYTAAENESVILTGSGVVGSFSVSYAGTTIEERDKYINSIAPQLYVENRNNVTSVNVLNITASGTFKGTPSPATAISTTRFSVNSNNIIYQLYFFNEAAMTLYNAVDSYVEGYSGSGERSKTEIKSILISDIIGRGLEGNDYNVSSYYAGFINMKTDVAAGDVSESYNGETLLGDSSALFTYNNGVLTLNADTLQVYYGTLLFVGKIQYTDSGSFNTDINTQRDYAFCLVRQLYSPSDGLGGKNTSYTSGETFKNVFGRENWMTSGTVTLSTGVERGISQIVYSLKNDHINYRRQLDSTLTDGVNITASEAIPATVDTEYQFFKIEWNSTTGRYELTVLSDEIPYLDTVAEVSVTITDGSTPITETYSFIIPGVYHYGTDTDTTDDIKFVPDIWIYLRMLQVYGSNDGYLYSANLAKIPQYDCSENGNIYFDCSYSKINTTVIQTIDGEDVGINIAYLVNPCGIINAVPALPDSTTVFDISGIEYISNTENMRFDNLRVGSLAPFGNFEKTSLKTLSMQSCAITAAMLTTDYPLYKQNILETVDLSGNTGIDVISGSVLYRTVKSLIMSGCNIESLDGIEDSLVQLRFLDVRSNKIKNFFPLTKISTLQEVRLGNNNIETDGVRNTYYGTHGEINICNIVALIHNGVKVYVTKNSTDIEVLLYEYYDSKYYLKGEIAEATTGTLGADITDSAAVSACGIKNIGGHLITLEEEYLSTVINAQFNFDNFIVSSAANAQSEIFPSPIHENDSSGAATYSVAVESSYGGTVAPGSTVTVTYRIYVQFGNGAYSAASGYRYNHNYTGGTYEKIFREITLSVTAP